MVTASRKTGIAATVADGMGCGADTSLGLAGLSANRYDSHTSCTIKYHYKNYASVLPLAVYPFSLSSPTLTSEASFTDLPCSLALGGEGVVVPSTDDPLLLAPLC